MLIDGNPVIESNVSNRDSNGRKLFAIFRTKPP